MCGPRVSRRGHVQAALRAAGRVAQRFGGPPKPWRRLVGGRAEAQGAKAGALHTLLLNKYYVDELYDATAIKGTVAGGRGLWTFDRVVIDGAVDGSGWLTRVSAWGSHMFDKHVVDGLVNLVGWIAEEGSFFVRRLQTGLVQNYALLMVVGVFAFLTLYLVAR